MKKTLFACLLTAIGSHTVSAQGFQSPAIQWNMPAVLDSYEDQVSDTHHTVIDMNGDGKPDLVDSENHATENVSDVFYNGSQKYWKVYLSSGSGFNATATQWNIPAVLDSYEERVSDIHHTVIDMNGDGKPDLVDSENEATTNVSDVFYNGGQKYWKVYLNTGSGFSATATQWNLPAVLDSDEERVSDIYHAVIDFNGDGKPDLVDSENQATENVSDVFLNGSQKYWKVYLNTGSGFSATATQWNIPAVLDSYDERVFDTQHTVIDMNGDDKPDLIDSENEATNSTSDVFFNGSQKHWKVYLNTGSGFSATAIQWNLPAVLDSYEEQVSDIHHTVIDFNGDGKPDLIDSENQATENVSDVFYNGSQKYWKVYLSTGSGFNTTAIQWNIPAVLDSYEERVSDTQHTVIDMNGDDKPDLIDSENEATNSSSDVFYNGGQKYWKVYLNNAPSLATDSFASTSKIALYPNPVKDILTISADSAMTAVSVYNLFGQMVLNKVLGSDTAEINVSGLASGTYMVKVAGKQSVKTLKIIKQ